jgi:chromosome segregation protein
LLKLKKLQILGFKSFCDRTELRFHGDGVAAIVGPNGCGKSNIADAICWVLGEQSAKSLRGTRMEDVIFGGAPARKPTGMAEVSLTLVDPDVYQGNVDEPEIEIREEMPEQDWDEEALRASAAEETDAYLEEVQPGKIGQPAGAQSAGAASPLPAEGENAPGVAQSSQQGEQDRPTATNGEAAPEGVGAVPANPNQVVLRIRRRKFKPLPLKKGEIVVTRRLFRSGDSEYLLNHKLCRLRDIQDIFMGTGLGPESYAIIEQGRIGQILSSKPTDRRAIIEEAAGITKFKTKKRLAEARLEDAKQNLNRVNDIFEEVTRQMNSLKRQASKAARYVRLRDEMRDKLRVVLASKFALWEREIRERNEELAAISEEIRGRGEHVQRLEEEHTERQQRGYAVENALRENREQLSQIARDMDRANSRQRQNEERCAELDQRTAAAQEELTQTAVKLETLQSERDGNRQVLDSAEAEVAAAARQLSQRQQDATLAAQALAEIERQQESRRIAVMETASQAAGVRNRITQAEEHVAALSREAQRLTSEIHSANLQLEEFGGERGQLALEFEGASQRVTALSAQITDLRQRLHEKRNAEGESKRRLDSLRAEYATALGRKSSLEAVITEHGYSTDSVRRLFKSGALNNGFAPVGVLADFLEVEDRYEHVVEDFLRDELNYVVVKSWDAANAGLNLLRTDVDGRATFMVHPNDSQAKFPFVLDEAHHAAPRRDRVVPLKNTIRVLDGFGKSLEVILPKLRDGYIVPDASLGRELALENPDAFFLAESGECFHNVTVTGGKQAVEGPLSMKRELREVRKNVADLERALREEEARVQTLGREIAELTSLLERLEGEKRDAEKQAMTSGHTLRQLDAEMGRVRQRLETYERELQRVGSEQAARRSLIAEKQAEAELLQRKREQLEEEIKAAQAEHAAMQAARDAAAQNASDARASMATLEERRRAAAQALQRINSLLAEVAARIHLLESQIASAATEKEQRILENARLAEQRAELATTQQSCQARELELTAEAEQLRFRLAEIELEARSAREALDAARDRRGEVAAVLAKLESDGAHMAEACQNDLGVTREQLRADETIVPVQGEQLAAEDAAHRELRTKLEAMGPVNMMALDEYNEVAQRHEFLETQRKDLLESIANTQETIREIETISREKFNEAFARINENFQMTFRKLFAGGHAFMRLTDEQNSAESGIDVVASPPGKKLQNVLLLSGGEKALTALSLLMGIFQYQPSPFCILDEVDAPLDDSNVGRFTELVRAMSAQTQFVLITHHKKTMSIAPVMYGVTMQEPGVSKLVSVRFGEQSQAVN